MAHFAELDNDNVVKRVIVVSNDKEAEGETYCHELLGGDWKQTSYNANIRKNYAAIGYTSVSYTHLTLPTNREV